MTGAFAGEPNEFGHCSHALQALQSVRRYITEKGEQEQRKNLAPYTIDKAKGKGNKCAHVRSCSFNMVCFILFGQQ